MKYLILSLGVTAAVIAIGCVAYKVRRLKRTAGAKSAQVPVRAVAADADIINSIPADLRMKCGDEALSGVHKITMEWLTDDLFVNVFCGDTDAMSRLCRHIVESSGGRYCVAASIGDQFDATRMTETKIVSGDHQVVEVKVCGVIAAGTGEVLFKAIVK
ncbi:MAG: hypothetical protein E7046_02885 [Lentisphaerae bacterium]|nr:hypothetical protein [Lentisphaerota bacterium]